MSLEYFLEQIEEERAWRESEIRFLDNSQRALADESDRMLMRRSILCLIYAHIEGFVKFSFSLYIDEINKKNLLCSQVKPVIAAAALAKEFVALNDKNKKSRIFSGNLPNEIHLHKLFRQSEFIEKILDVRDYEVRIPEEYINTEDNVGKDVLEKLMFQVGLNYQDLSGVYPPLYRLLNVRNDISHGKRRAGIDQNDYDEFLGCGRSIISGISRKLTQAYGNQEFLNLMPE